MLRARLSSLDDCNLFSLNLRSFKVESFSCYYSFSKRFLIFFSPGFPPSLDVLYPVYCTLIDVSWVFAFSSRSLILYLVSNHPLLYFPLLCFIFLLILVYSPSHHHFLSFALTLNVISLQRDEQLVTRPTLPRIPVHFSSNTSALQSVVRDTTCHDLRGLSFLYTNKRWFVSYEP